MNKTEFGNGSVKKFTAATAATLIMLAMLIAIASAIPAISVDDVAGTTGSSEVSLTTRSTATLSESDIGPTSESVMPGFWNYYVTKRFDSFPGNNWVNAVRIGAHVTPTTVYIDTNCNDIADIIIDMTAHDCWEKDLPTGTHIWSTEEITVHQYDDSYADWEMALLPPVRYWGKDYFYGGVFTYGLGTNHVLIQAAYNSTNVTIDLDCDGIPEYNKTLNQKEIWDWNLLASTHPNKTLPGGAQVGFDTRAGAHITSDKPVQVHVFAEHQAYFGSACNLIPTHILGKEYFVPRINCTRPSTTWDMADEVIVVATQPGITHVEIDTDLSCRPNVTFNLSGPCDWAHWPPVSMDDAWVNCTYVKANKTVAVFYSSPGGGHQWDGFLSQMVPRDATRQHYWSTVNWSTINWNLTTVVWPGAPQIYICAYENGTTVNIDRDCDGIPDKNFSMDFKDGGVVYTPAVCGEHIWTTDPNKPIAVYQGWYGDAADVLSPVSYRTVIPATVVIKPETLNLKSKGLFTAFITLPEPYDIADIDISTVVCEGAPAVKGMVADDNKYIAKFDRKDLRGDLPTGDEVEMTVTGKLYDGTSFEGSDTIRVIS